MPTAAVEREELQQLIQVLPDDKVSTVLLLVRGFYIENNFPRVPPEIEDAAFQALALKNAESWL